MLEFSVVIFRLVIFGTLLLIGCLYYFKYKKIHQEHKDDKKAYTKNMLGLTLAPPLLLWLNKLRKENKENPGVSKRELRMWAAFGVLVVGLVIFIAPNLVQTIELARTVPGTIDEFCKALKSEKSLQANQHIIKKPRDEIAEFSEDFNTKIRLFRNLHTSLVSGDGLMKAYSEVALYAEKNGLGQPDIQRAFEDTNGLRSGSTKDYMTIYNGNHLISAYEQLAFLIKKRTQPNIKKMIDQTMRENYMIDVNYDTKVDDRDLEIIKQNLMDAGAAGDGLEYAMELLEEHFKQIKKEMRINGFCG